MPLTKAGRETLSSMIKTYGSEKKGKEVFYASINAGKLKGMEADEDDEYTEDECDCKKPKPPIRITIRRRR